MAAARYPTREKASIEIYGKSGSFIAELKNVSVTGACLEWSQEGMELHAGDLLRVTVILKVVNRRHNLNAQVVWKNGKKSGVNFLKSAEVLEKILE